LRRWGSDYIPLGMASRLPVFPFLPTSDGKKILGNYAPKPTSRCNPCSPLYVACSNENECFSVLMVASQPPASAAQVAKAL
jgi:hypothetical protein